MNQIYEEYKQNIEKLIKFRARTEEALLNLNYSYCMENQIKFPLSLNKNFNLASRTLEYELNNNPKIHKNQNNEFKIKIIHQGQVNPDFKELKENFPKISLINFNKIEKLSYKDIEFKVKHQHSINIEKVTLLLPLNTELLSIFSLPPSHKIFKKNLFPLINYQNEKYALVNDYKIDIEESLANFDSIYNSLVRNKIKFISKNPLDLELKNFFGVICHLCSFKTYECCSKHHKGDMGFQNEIQNFTNNRNIKCSIDYCNEDIQNFSILNEPEIFNSLKCGHFHEWLSCNLFRDKHPIISLWNIELCINSEVEHFDSISFFDNKIILTECARIFSYNTKFSRSRTSLIRKKEFLEENFQIDNVKIGILSNIIDLDREKEEDLDFHLCYSNISDYSNIINSV